MSVEFDEARAEICQLRQTIQSRQSDVDFSHSHLEVQRENDKLQRRVRQLVLELGQRRQR